MKTAVTIVMLLAAAAYQPNVVRVPTIVEYKEASLTQRDAWAETFGVEDFKACLEAGLLTPGESYDLNLPPNKTAIQFNRWQRELAAIEPGTVSIKETQEWKQLRKDFRELTRWVARNVR